MDHFTPVSSLIGGALIGLSAVVLMLWNGRIAGISGISAGLLPPIGTKRDSAWRVAFVAGLILAPLLLEFAGGERPRIAFIAPIPLMIVAGALVGFGTVLANGCTSGHGVCGVARLSPRSLVATGIFMAAGLAMTFLLRHMILSGG